MKRQDKKNLKPRGLQLNWSDFRFAPYRLPVRVPQILGLLETYMIINFKICKINRDIHKLIRIATLIIIKNVFALSELPRKTKNQETRPRNIYTSERLSTRRINTWQTVIKLNSISNGLLAA